MNLMNDSLFERRKGLCCYPDGTSLTMSTSHRNRVKLLIAWTVACVLFILAVTYLTHLITDWSSHGVSRVFFVVFNKAITIDECHPGSFLFCSLNKKCISYSQRCDRFQDCPDDSDEKNCECLSREYACIEGRCISELFLCDGMRDCPSGDDESDFICEVCPFNEFRCFGRKTICLMSTLVCDGTKQCSQGEDEQDCVHFRKKNELRLKKSFQDEASICYATWDRLYEEYFCKRASKGSAIASFPLYKRRIHNPVGLNSTQGSHLIYHQRASCPNKTVVGLKCYEEDCGKRKVPENFFKPYLIYGEQAARGEFPWQAELKCRDFTCGATLLSHKWMITAGHCVYDDGPLKASECLVYIGSVHRHDSNWQVLQLENIFLHDLYHDQKLKKDLALLKLMKPVTYDTFVQPICTPYKPFVEADYLYCVSVGFGKTIKGAYSPVLLKVRMKERRYYHQAEELCIGTETGSVYSNICKGDSGSPFMCQKKDDAKWTLVGVHSYVTYDQYSSKINHSMTSTYCQKSFVVNVQVFSDWITKTMERNS